MSDSKGSKEIDLIIKRLESFRLKVEKNKKGYAERYDI